MSNLLRYVIIDVEASGFDGFPIEVGWCDQDGEADSHLIRPAWDWTRWDLRAERLHGITRDFLEAQGEPHDVVAQLVSERLARWRREEVIVASDNPTFDREWLVMLLRRADIGDEVRLADVTELYVAATRPLFSGLPEVGDPGLAAAYNRGTAQAAAIIADAKARMPMGPKHRAVDDARRLREIVETVRIVASSARISWKRW